MTSPHEQSGQTPEFATEEQANRLRETIERITFHEGYADLVEPRQSSGQVREGDKLLSVYDQEPQYTYPPLAGSVIRGVAPEAADLLGISDTDSVQIAYTPECFTKTSADEEAVYARPMGMVSIERPEAENDADFFELFTVAYSGENERYEVTDTSDNLELVEGLMDVDSEVFNVTDEGLILKALERHDELRANLARDTREPEARDGVEEDFGVKQTFLDKAKKIPQATYDKAVALQQVLDALYPEQPAGQQ